MLKINGLPLSNPGNLTFAEADLDLLRTQPPTTESLALATEIGKFTAELFNYNEGLKGSEILGSLMLLRSDLSHEIKTAFYKAAYEEDERLQAMHADVLHANAATTNELVEGVRA